MKLGQMKVEIDESGEYFIRDCDGNSILGSSQYYPWVPDLETIKEFVRRWNVVEQMMEYGLTMEYLENRSRGRSGSENLKP